MPREDDGRPVKCCSPSPPVALSLSLLPSSHSTTPPLTKCSRSLALPIPHIALSLSNAHTHVLFRCPYTQHIQPPSIVFPAQRKREKTASKTTTTTTRPPQHTRHAADARAPRRRRHAVPGAAHRAPLGRARRRPAAEGGELRISALSFFCVVFGRGNRRRGGASAPSSRSRARPAPLLARIPRPDARAGSSRARAS